MNQPMLQEFRGAVKNVLFIGGGTDAGKSTVAETLGARHGWRVYHYDRTDGLHHALLALNHPAFAAFMRQSLDERWIEPSVTALVERSLESFGARLPFVLNDLVNLVNDRPLIAEGFGLTPDLVAPLLSEPNQGIWLLPSDAFKLESMRRRDKPAWRHETSRPELVFNNLLERDRALAARCKREAEARGLTVLEVDGSLSVEGLADRLEAHFAA